MSVPGLRGLLRGLIGGLKDHETHAGLGVICEKLAMGPPGPEGSKRDRLWDSFDATRESDLVRIAERYLQCFPPNAETRNRIQELVWENTPCPEVPKLFRREVANRLDDEVLFLNAKHFMELLERTWVLKDSFAALLGNASSSLRTKIEKHVVQNPGDWPVDDLFEELGAYTCPDRRFLCFLEGLASADVRPDVESQSRFVGVINTALLPCQIELQQTGTEGGYPAHTAVAIGRGIRMTAKNLIFASQVKPDLRFSDAINNDVEIVTNRDKVLIYDRPIAVGGLTWQELQDRWGAENNLSSEQAKKNLYYRLRHCLPENSPPQKLFFKSYFQRFAAAIPMLPALLPEVWLHWDPKTARERGKDALLRFRMDFLLLLPNGIRVVIEVDGKHHYADNRDQADPRRYADMVAADRDLRLSGYDVYRFGAAELNEVNGFSVASDFFDRLFKLYKLPISKEHQPFPGA
jgi:hypothetical protein